MKANFVSTRVAKTVVALVATVVFFAANPLTSQAASIDKKSPATLSESQVSINYIGSKDNSVIFSVKFENPNADKFWVIVKNDAGETIYREQFSDVHFSRAICLEKDEAEIRPTFIIRKGKEESVHSFAVNLARTEQVIVTKL